MMNNLGIVLILLAVTATVIFGVRAINTLQLGPRNPDNKLTPHRSFVESNTNSLTIETVKLKDEKTDSYEYIIGVNLTLALFEVRNNRCSIILGLVQDIKPGEDEKVKHVDFFVNDWMTGRREGAKDDLPLVFNTRVSNKADWNEKPFEGVRLEIGQRLIVSYCPQTNFTRIALSDESYFPIVKEVIEYDALDLFEERSDKILDRIRSEKNLIFEGYIIERFSRMGTAGNVNNRAKVLVELLGTVSGPLRTWGSVLGTLSEYLETNDSLAASTRDEIVKKLIGIGGGKDKYKAVQSIFLLVRLSEKLNFKGFLDKNKSVNLRENYETLVKSKIQPTERQKFEHQLLSN